LSRTIATIPFRSSCCFRYEGQTMDFELPGANGTKAEVKGKIIPSRYVPHTALRAYSRQYAYSQQAYMQSGSEQPAIAVDGRLQFSMPGQPPFPKLADDTVLKPTLAWELRMRQLANHANSDEFKHNDSHTIEFTRVPSEGRAHG
jgi:hypothetical protein